MLLHEIIYDYFSSLHHISTKGRSEIRIELYFAFLEVVFGYPKAFSKLHSESHF